MASARVGPDVLLCGALTVLLTLGIVTPAEALSGLSNEGMVTVAVLFVGRRRTARDWRYAPDHGGACSDAQAQLRRPGAPDVSRGWPQCFYEQRWSRMLLPVVSDWTRQLRLSASKFMIPLSYATILGGTCTLIAGEHLAHQWPGEKTPGLLHRLIHAWVGVPCALAMGYVLLTSRWLLPELAPVFSTAGDAENIP